MDVEGASVAEAANDEIEKLVYERDDARAEVDRCQKDLQQAADTIERLTKERDEFNTETLRVIDRNLKLMAEKASMAAERDAARAEVERLKAELSARSEDE